MRPKFPLVVSRAGEPELLELVEDLVTRGVEVAGVLSESDTAACFADLWRERTGRKPRLHLKLGTYEADRVVFPEQAPPGVLRPARATSAEEVELLTEWARAFIAETHVDPVNPRTQVEVGMREGRLFVWDVAGVAVSSVRWGAPTPTGARISFVYTPPANRGQGYAGAAVAALTDQLLKSGRSRCFLFTDLDNPTSNRIYKKIGYRHILDCADYRFE
jgi:GNAT superfamily N-acetyltransferase